MICAGSSSVQPFVANERNLPEGFKEFSNTKDIEPGIVSSTA
jgi:hypothetical protein